MIQTPYKLHRHIKKSDIFLLAIVFIPLLIISLSGIFDPEAKLWHRAAGLIITILFFYITITIVKNLRSFKYILLDNKKITVHLRDGSNQEYPVPETIKEVKFDDHIWIDFDNARKKVRLSESMFKEQQVFKQWLSENIPVVRCYKDGRVEQASFFDDNTIKDSVLAIGTPDTVIVTPPKIRKN